MDNEKIDHIPLHPIVPLDKTDDKMLYIKVTVATFVLSVILYTIFSLSIGFVIGSIFGNGRTYISHLHTGDYPSDPIPNMIKKSKGK